jgi:hypothetical protein
VGCMGWGNTIYHLREVDEQEVDEREVDEREVDGCE